MSCGCTTLNRFLKTENQVHELVLDEPEPGHVEDLDEKVLQCVAVVQVSIGLEKLNTHFTKLFLMNLSLVMWTTSMRKSYNVLRLYHFQYLLKN